MSQETLSAAVRHLCSRVIATQAGNAPDAQLLAMFLERREHGAFEALLRRHGPMVFGVCQRVLGDGHDAEDAFQATFLIFARKAASIRQTESVGSWLYGVAWHTAKRACASRTRFGLFRTRLTRLTAGEAALKPAESPLEQQEIRSILDQELHRLPEKYRTPIILCHLEGKTHEAAAKQLGCPVGTVSGRLSRACEMLRQRLSRRGLGISAVGLAVALDQTAPTALSATLIHSTVEAALTLTTGKLAATSVISTSVLALMKGGLTTMGISKLKMTAAAVVAVCGLSVGGGAWMVGASNAESESAVHGTTNLLAKLNDKDENPTVKADKNLLQNAGMEEGDESPSHWSQGMEVDGVAYVWDKENGKKGKASLCLHKTAQRYFPIAQWHQTVKREGEHATIKVSAQVKAEGVTKAILDVVFLDDKDEWILHKWVSYIGAKNAGDAPANHDWKEYSGQVDIPPTAKKIQIGLQIYGPGKVWFDEVRAEYAK